MIKLWKFSGSTDQPGLEQVQHLACEGLRWGMRLLGRIIPRERQIKINNIVEFEVTDPSKHIPHVIQWASKGEDLRVTIPSTLLRIWGAFGFYDGWNPMMPLLQNDAEDFRRFFKLFRPENLSEMYFLGEQFGPVPLGPMENPWLLISDRRPAPGGNGLSADNLRSKSFGPPTSKAIDREFINRHKRMQRVVRSIQKQGYRPDRYGDIQGYFIRLNGEYRFVINGGKHRATALTSLGFKSIPVRMRPFFPRVIDGERVRDWPLVRSGEMSEDFALAVMRRFFEFDGTQQRNLVFRTRNLLDEQMS